MSTAQAIAATAGKVTQPVRSKLQKLTDPAAKGQPASMGWLRWAVDGGTSMGLETEPGLSKMCKARLKVGGFSFRIEYRMQRCADTLVPLPIHDRLSFPHAASGRVPSWTQR